MRGLVGGWWVEARGEVSKLFIVGRALEVMFVDARGGVNMIKVM